MEGYNHKEIESKWQKIWDEKGIYKTEYNSDKPKQFVLDMFPYPSGEGLHIGHPRGYIATDVYSRLKKMQGFNVLHPMGWDAFGLPAENFAIKNKAHPRVAVEKNVNRFKEQLALIGFNYDWSHEVNTTDPHFYKWTQWIFLQMFKKGLAFESWEPINWCPSCQTGLANEDVEADGTCERCGTAVEKKPMRQWVLKITEYADRMLVDLDKLPKWPEGVKEAQRNWIGRSEGSEIDFKIKDFDEKITVFTTRADTLFGVTYVVLAPEHELVSKLIESVSNKIEVENFINQAKNKSDLDRQQSKEKNGVCLQGIFAINPANNEELPVWVADYVLAGYGTGAVMAVPAHDERDFEFSEKYNLPIKYVVLDRININDNVPNHISWINFSDQSQEYIDNLIKHNSDFFDKAKKSIDNRSKNIKTVITFPGVLIGSDKFDGLKSEEAKQKITEKVGGKIVVNYKIKDWVFSRQRYWGEPIPIIHCEKCGVVAVPEDQLPVLLPEVDSYEPTGTGESPLAGIDEWVNTNCPNCFGPAKRETNTMPQWAGSSWYYLRYIDPKNNEKLIDPEKEKTWMPVDVYVGGDHATRHLIYARFWHKFLYDIGVVSTEEPFPRLEFLGFILAEDGRKMSKRWGNVINPDDVVNNFGADAFRLYEMFIGPFENTVRWNNDGMVGTYRFLERVWKFKNKTNSNSDNLAQKVLHKTIKKVTEDIESFKFNTAVSSLMICLNEFESAESVSVNDYKSFLQILAPFAPHMTEELWSLLGEEGSIHTTDWPVYDEKSLIDNEIVITVQVNGRVRDTFIANTDLSEEDIKNIALSREAVGKWVPNKDEIKKIIFVKNKIINFVV